MSALPAAWGLPWPYSLGVDRSPPRRNDGKVSIAVSHCTHSSCVHGRDAQFHHNWCLCTATSSQPGACAPLSDGERGSARTFSPALRGCHRLRLRNALQSIKSTNKEPPALCRGQRNWGPLLCVGDNATGALHCGAAPCKMQINCGALHCLLARLAAHHLRRSPWT